MLNDPSRKFLVSNVIMKITLSLARTGRKRIDHESTKWQKHEKKRRNFSCFLRRRRMFSW